MKRTCKACASLFRIRFAESLQYRVASLSGASISIFWALIEIVVYTVFYTYAENRSSLASSLTLAQVVSYTWIAQFLVPLQPMNIDQEILAQITSGDVGIELCRPLDLYAHWFAKTAAGRLGGFWLRGAVILLVGFLVPASIRLSTPASALGFGLFLLSAGCAFLLCTAYGLLITAVRLGITWGEGPSYILMLTGSVLSGAYLPLQLWPKALQPLLLLQPFSGYLDIPARLYVGSIAPAQGLEAILLQLCWAGVFIVCGRALMQRKLKTLIIQGG